jgi:hypothetical protein
MLIIELKGGKILEILNKLYKCPRRTTTQVITCPADKKK